MPNWCNNTLTISGSKEDVAKFVNAVSGFDCVLTSDVAKQIQEQELNDRPKWGDRLAEYKVALELSHVEYFKKYYKQHNYDSDGNGNLGKNIQFNFNKIHPCPYELTVTTEGGSEEHKKIMAENEKKFGYRSWYDWHTNNWGTKWDADFFGSQYIEGDTLAVFEFATAWSPPKAWIEEVGVNKFPTLDFHLAYDEPGMCFAGDIYVSEGDYSEEDREFLNTCQECGEDASDVEYRHEVDEQLCDECNKNSEEV